MKEISILDYLKSFFSKGGTKSFKKWIQHNQENNDDIKKRKTKSIFLNQPMILIFAILCAVIAQLLLEPPNRYFGFSITLYLLSGILFLLSIKVKKETENSEYISRHDQKIRILPFILSLLLGLITFILFKDNTFSEVNLLTWGLSIGLFVFSVWTKNEKPIKSNLVANNKKIAQWSVLMAIIIGLILFFRLFKLDSIPGEMYSDHAEKLLDVLDIFNGKTPIFFTRNTGREAFQFYLTYLIIKVFNTGFSFLSLKIGTAICSLILLPFIYLIGKEIGNNVSGILATLMVGVAYWPNIISRIGLRYILYPLFVAPAMFYFIKGISNNSRNYFILSGLFLGLGLHGYSPIRVLPFIFVIGMLIAIVHKKDVKSLKQIFENFFILVMTAFILFLPLFRFAIENPLSFSFRTLSRLTSIEQVIADPIGFIFIKNLWNAVTMFFYNNGEIWVHSVPLRPALDVISAAFLFLGFIYIAKRYFKFHNWVDLFIIICIPLLMLPSILSLAFPRENPSLNRTAGAVVPVFVIASLGMTTSFQQLFGMYKKKLARTFLTMIFGLLIFIMVFSNYQLVFIEYEQQYKQNSWNTSEIGNVIKIFVENGGNKENAYVVPYPYWVDTRLVGINAGFPEKDYALWQKDFISTKKIEGKKLFILNQNDQESLDLIQKIYPESTLQISNSEQRDKKFIIIITN